MRLHLEGVGQQLGGREPLSTADIDGRIGGQVLLHHLATRPARHARPRGVKARHRQCRERPAGARGERGKDGVSLRADGQPIADRFNVAADIDASVGVSDRCANAEMRVGRVGTCGDVACLHKQGSVQVIHERTRAGDSVACAMLAQVRQ